MINRSLVSSYKMCAIHRMTRYAINEYEVLCRKMATLCFNISSGENLQHTKENLLIVGQCYFLFSTQTKTA